MYFLQFLEVRRYVLDFCDTFYFLLGLLSELDHIFQCILMQKNRNKGPGTSREVLGQEVLGPGTKGPRT